MKKYVRSAVDRSVENEDIMKLKKVFKELRTEYPLQYIVEAYEAVIESEIHK